MSAYILAPLAEADLDDIWEFGADRWGVRQANIYAVQLRRAIERVAARPARGRMCDDIRPGYHRISVGSHVVFYRTMETGIVIVRVLHQNMDFDRHL
ncbi:MAG: type II toxin-antitoxin system RelE/ParE family toxin [Rhizomicrobium sp.]